MATMRAVSTSSADRTGPIKPSCRPDQDDDAAGGAGAVHVFVESAESWQQQSYLKAARPGSGDQFGWTVAMSDDAGTLAVGAPLENYDATGVGGTPTSAAFNSGAVFLY